MSPQLPVTGDPMGSNTQVSSKAQSPTRERNLAVGAVAGVISVTVFTVLHQIFINAIWWMFPIMAIAGAVCGLTLSWCYDTLVTTPSQRSWWGYIAMFTGMFGLLGLASGLIYEPIITMTEMLESTGGNPIPISETIGLMAAFTLAWSGGLVLFYRKGWREFGIALATTFVLMLFLGFNVSTIGLVDFPTEAWALMAEFFGYLAALGFVFGAAFVVLVRWPAKGTVPNLADHTTTSSEGS